MVPLATRVWVPSLGGIRAVVLSIPRLYISNSTSSLKRAASPTAYPTRGDARSMAGKRSRGLFDTAVLPKYGAKRCSRSTRRTAWSRKTRCFASSLAKYRSSVGRHREGIEDDTRRIQNRLDTRQAKHDKAERRFSPPQNGGDKLKVLRAADSRPSEQRSPRAEECGASKRQLAQGRLHHRQRW